MEGVTTLVVEEETQRATTGYHYCQSIIGPDSLSWTDWRVLGLLFQQPTRGFLLLDFLSFSFFFFFFSLLEFSPSLACKDLHLPLDVVAIDFARARLSSTLLNQRLANLVWEISLK